MEYMLAIFAQSRANRTIGILRRNVCPCHQEVKDAAYKGLVRSVLEYGSSVWNPQGEIESMQKRATRFGTGNNNYETKSMTGILGQLKWESLKKTRKDNRLILLYKRLKDKASICRGLCCNVHFSGESWRLISPDHRPW